MSALIIIRQNDDRQSFILICINNWPAIYQGICQICCCSGLLVDQLQIGFNDLAFNDIHSISIIVYVHFVVK